MKGKIFILLTGIFLSVIFFTQFKLVNRPVLDNDEGIYLTSFSLVDKGHPAYKKTYFSQPPGYLLSVYPGFILFGKTLPAARLTISLWSFIGLLAIVWIGYELKDKWASLLAVGLLSLIPHYFNQALTFQSDVLITTFSLISLAALIRFRKRYFLPWFIISAIFFNLAFWTKFDVTFFPSIMLAVFIAFKEKKLSFKKIINLFLIFIAVSVGFFITFIAHFGIKEVFYNSILLRFQAATSSSSPTLLYYLKKDVVLTVIIILNIFLIFFKRKNFRHPTNIILLWGIFTFILFIFYRPLFSHHLVMLAVPMVLLFSLLTGYFLKDKKLFALIVVGILTIALGARIYLTIQSSTKLVGNQQQSAIEIIKTNTKIDDIVVSDEEILTGLSGRTPPPELSDVSQVRIKSGNLTPENYAKIINIYKPKLIIPWNGRLELLKNFKENLTDYRLLISFSKSKNIYIRIDR
jgi:4-amino-4-deoxy-L-arabinose transferase-like glycosyltransferase